MPKICLIGNSHLAALKLGWPQIQAQFPGMELVFFAVAGLSLQLEIVGGKLVAPDERIRKRLAVTSERDGDIEPGYDAYVLCGLALSSMRALRAYAAKRAELRAAGVVGGTAVEDFVAAMEPAVRDTIAFDIAAKLRTLTHAPIFVIATPLPAYERHVELWQRLKERKQEATAVEAYEIACDKVADSYAATFIPQPVETVDESGLTSRNRFYLLRPDQVAGEKSQHTHMNIDYGVIVLRDALEKIEAQLARS